MICLGARLLSVPWCDEFGPSVVIIIQCLWVSRGISILHSLAGGKQRRRGNWRSPSGGILFLLFLLFVKDQGRYGARCGGPIAAMCVCRLSLLAWPPGPTAALPLPPRRHLASCCAFRIMPCPTAAVCASSIQPQYTPGPQARRVPSSFAPRPVPPRPAPSFSLYPYNMLSTCTLGPPACLPPCGCRTYRLHCCA